MGRTGVAIFGIVVGLMALAGGIFGWDFYMDSPKSRFWVYLLGPTGARVFFVVMGILLTGFGVYLLVP